MLVSSTWDQIFLRTKSPSKTRWARPRVDFVDFAIAVICAVMNIRCQRLALAIRSAPFCSILETHAASSANSSGAKGSHSLFSYRLRAIFRMQISKETFRHILWVEIFFLYRVLLRL